MKQVVQSIATKMAKLLNRKASQADMPSIQVTEDIIKTLTGIAV